ncbi:HET-domain-containing protein [Annulohypoxylon maeteangense]|uniref:HET-domain-containing protein n=1 Tax=Annulohypoxylon maeteangense TaxID=1927788 RepID=UPI00200868EC|nr:HET-domain-containing protein [Annulohypoxylon maeteangense]KAI0885435.1 HET-domain-containing protein [Annulohypoxylon maeteangense]
MRCFNGCILLGKHWIQRVKRDQHSNYKRSESSKVEVDEKLGQFSYSTVPLRIYHDNFGLDIQGDGIPTKSSKTIRVLRIFPTRGLNGLLECHIRSVELNETQTVNYDALSYTWGPTTQHEVKIGMNAERHHAIICNGKELSITRNLLNCLMQLRESGHYRDLWVDAICINQDDKDERGEQVSIMADVYRLAERVIVWLGAADDSTPLADELIGRLDDLSNEDLRSINPQACENNHNTDLLGHTNSHEHWMALVSLFERTWFTRAWVVQELVLAQETTVLCGNYEFDWKTMVSISKFMAERTSANTYKSQSSFKKPAKLAEIKRDILNGTGDVLLRSLIRCRTYEASDDHDKVYSLIGLAGPRNENNPMLYPEYDCSVSEVYTKVTEYLLAVSNDLHVLAHAEGDEFRHVSGLPSWVPDWSVKKDLGLRITGYTRYEAAGKLSCFREIRDNYVLVLRGFEFDTISRVGESKENVNETKDCSDWLDLLGELERDYPDKGHKDAFWRTQLLDTGPRGKVPIEKPWDKSFEVWMGLCSHEPSKEEMDMAHEFETSFTHSLNLRLFRTSGGHLGCGTLSCKKGDLVWIVQGSRVPLILRPTLSKQEGQTTYNLVGGTYLHGFMQGEALEGRKSTEILLV